MRLAGAALGTVTHLGGGGGKCQYWGDHPPKHEKNMKTIKISPTPTPGPYKDRYDRGIRVPLAPRGARPIDFYTFDWGYRILGATWHFFGGYGGVAGLVHTFRGLLHISPPGPYKD